jgi:hypothetical protein
MNALNDFLRGKAHLYHSGDINRNPRACHVPSKEHTTQSVDLIVAVLFPHQHKTRVLPSLRYPTISCGQNYTHRSDTVDLALHHAVHHRAIPRANQKEESHPSFCSAMIQHIIWLAVTMGQTGPVHVVHNL